MIDSCRIYLLIQQGLSYLGLFYSIIEFIPEAVLSAWLYIHTLMWLLFFWKFHFCKRMQLAYTYHGLCSDFLHFVIHEVSQNEFSLDQVWVIIHSSHVWNIWRNMDDSQTEMTICYVYLICTFSYKEVCQNVRRAQMLHHYQKAVAIHRVIIQQLIRRQFEDWLWYL